MNSILKCRKLTLIRRLRRREADLKYHVEPSSHSYRITVRFQHQIRRHSDAAKRSVAATIRSLMPKSCPAQPTITSSLRGQRFASCHDVISGELKSSRPWIKTAGILQAPATARYRGVAAAAQYLRADGPSCWSRGQLHPSMSAEHSQMCHPWNL